MIGFQFGSLICVPRHPKAFLHKNKGFFTQKVRTIEFNHCTFLENNTFDFVEKSERKECSARIAISKLYVVAQRFACCISRITTNLLLEFKNDKKNCNFNTTYSVIYKNGPTVTFKNKFRILKVKLLKIKQWCDRIKPAQSHIYFYEFVQQFWTVVDLVTH